MCFHITSILSHLSKSLIVSFLFVCSTFVCSKVHSFFFRLCTLALIVQINLGRNEDSMVRNLYWITNSSLCMFLGEFHLDSFEHLIAFIITSSCVQLVFGFFDCIFRVAIDILQFFYWYIFFCISWILNIIWAPPCIRYWIYAFDFTHIMRNA